MRNTHSNSNIGLGRPPVAPTPPEQVEVLVNAVLIGWVGPLDTGSMADVELADMAAIGALLDASIAYNNILLPDGTVPSVGGVVAGSTNVAIVSFAVAEEYAGKKAVGYVSDGAGGYVHSTGGAYFDITQEGALLNANGEHYLNGGDGYAADCGRESFDGLTQYGCGAVKISVCLAYTPEAVEDPCGWVIPVIPLQTTTTTTSPDADNISVTQDF